MYLLSHLQNMHIFMLNIKNSIATSTYIGISYHNYVINFIINIRNLGYKNVFYCHIQIVQFNSHKHSLPTYLPTSYSPKYCRSLLTRNSVAVWRRVTRYLWLARRCAPTY